MTNVAWDILATLMTLLPPRINICVLHSWCTSQLPSSREEAFCPHWRFTCGSTKPFPVRDMKVNSTRFPALQQKFKTREWVNNVFHLSNETKRIEIRHKNELTSSNCGSQCELCNKGSEPAIQHVFGKTDKGTNSPMNLISCPGDLLKLETSNSFFPGLKLLWITVSIFKRFGFLMILKHKHYCF